MSPTLDANGIALLHRQRINELIAASAGDAEHRSQLQILAKAVWLRAFEAGVAQGLEMTDPARPVAEPPEVIALLKARAEMARDGALMRDAMKIMDMLLRVLTPEQLAAVAPSLMALQRQSRPALHVVASDGQLVEPAEPSRG